MPGRSAREHRGRFSVLLFEDKVTVLVLPPVFSALAQSGYRDLKYTVDLLHFHGKSAQAVLQEIFCSLTMFNHCAYLCVHANILRTPKDTKYQYKINFANAVGSCRSYLHGSISETELLDRKRC